MSTLPVANFHGLGTPPIPIEDDERPYWLSQEQYAEALARLRASRQPFLITFDDGNLSDVEIGLPALQAGERAIVFACSDRTGREGYLAANELRNIAGMENITLGSHGAAHASWRTADSGERAREIADSRKALEDVVGVPVRDAGIPFGDYDGSVLKAISAAGYTSAYSSDGGPRLSGASPIPRLSLRGDRPIAEQIDALLAACAPLRRARQEAKLRAKVLLK